MTFLRRLAVAAAALAFGRLLTFVGAFRRRRRAESAAAPVAPAGDQRLPSAGALVHPMDAAVAASAVLPAPAAPGSALGLEAPAAFDPSAEAPPLADLRESGPWSLGGEALVDDEEVAEAYRAEARLPHVEDAPLEVRPEVAEITAQYDEIELPVAEPAAVEEAAIEVAAVEEADEAVAEPPVVEVETLVVETLVVETPVLEAPVVEAAVAEPPAAVEPEPAPGAEALEEPAPAAPPVRRPPSIAVIVARGADL